MCCLFTTLVLFGPRLGILVWWLIAPARWNAAFETFLWPFLGFLFLPWTTLMYVVVFPGGVTGFDWEACWREYRKGVFAGFAVSIVSPVLVVRTVRGDRMFTTMARRYAQMGLDLDIDEFIR